MSGQDERTPIGPRVPEPAIPGDSRPGEQVQEAASAPPPPPGGDDDDLQVTRLPDRTEAQLAANRELAARAAPAPPIDLTHIDFTTDLQTDGHTEPGNPPIPHAGRRAEPPAHGGDDGDFDLHIKPLPDLTEAQLAANRELAARAAPAPASPRDTQTPGARPVEDPRRAGGQGTSRVAPKPQGPSRPSRG